MEIPAPDLPAAMLFAGRRPAAGKARRQFPEERKKTVSSETQILSHKRTEKRPGLFSQKDTGNPFFIQDPPPAGGAACRLYTALFLCVESYLLLFLINILLPLTFTLTVQPGLKICRPEWSACLIDF
ncbi:MAG TPA: hypothetical protein H9700_03655 [Candidatus Eisenbergiella intestinipullorum]|nr:hypothetical protein [Candidatus Eisenbergiella intestinipullorum]